MDCPKCGKETRVTDSRPVEGQPCVRRRRHCDSCQERCTTHERYSHDEDWMLEQGREEGREEMRREFQALTESLARLTPKPEADPDNP